MKTHRLAMALLLFSSAAFAQAPAQTALPRGFEKVTSVEGITEYRLPNGLRVLLAPDPSKPTATVNITYLVGSKHENYGETGMAHLLEHLVFKGTPKHPNIPQELTAHGARPNGTTWWDRTNYFETFNATDENLEWALDLEADRMVNSHIARKDLDSEMTVVRNEFEAGENDPSSVLEERTMATSYLWHNYGNTTIGARSDLENVPIDRLQAFYRRYYQPDNAVLLVAGKIDEAKTLNLINKHFAPIPKPTRVLPETYTLDPAQDGERSVTLRRTGDVQLVHAIYKFSAGSHPDTAAGDVLAELMTSAPSGRLYKALVESKKAAGVSGTLYNLREPGFIIFRSEVRQDASLDDARDTLIATVEKASAPTAEEVDRARTTILKNMELTQNDSTRLGLELSEWIAAGDWRLFFLHRDRVRKVTAADVARVASTYLKPSNRTIGLFIPTAKPDRSEIPATPVIADLVKDYKGDAAVSVGEAFDPSPANIESRTTRITLPNGAKVALLPKETRGDVVVAAMNFRFGDEKSLMNQATAARLVGQMLMRGTAKHTREQIKDEFDRLKARVNVSSVPTNATVSIETTRENLPAVLKLLAEVLREPAFAPAEFETLKQQQLAGLEEDRSDPRVLAGTELQRHMSPYPKGDVRYISTVDEDIADMKAVTLDQVKKFYTSFYGGSNAQLAIVGDFDSKEIGALVRDHFGSWKSPAKFARVPQVFTAVPAMAKSIETPDKANAIFLAAFNTQLRDDHPDYPALVLGNFMLGGGFLNSRLATRIRQKEGLSYGVGSGFNASPLDQYATFFAQAIYAPQNADKLEAAFKDEIAKMLKDGFTEQEVKDAKSGLLQRNMTARAQDAALSRTLANYLYWNRTLAWDEALEKKIAALTPQQVNDAMRRLVDPSKLTIVKAGDFAKAAAEAAGKKPPVS
jgi:zinc protease